jgi:hypothetical protein
MKRFLAVCAILVLLAPSVLAKPVTITTSIELKLSETILKYGTTLINAAYFLKPLGGYFVKTQNTTKYTIYCRNHVLGIQSGVSAFTIDGKKGTFTKNQTPFVKNNKLMVPARKLTELFGGKVEGRKLVFTKKIFKDIIFLHHSCGQNWIADGGIREKLTNAGFEFWDHGYNGDGLTNPKGENTGQNYDVPDDNTNPDGLANIFSQPVTNPPTNTFSKLLTHDVIIIKSCFPVSDIYSDEDLYTLFEHYKIIRESVRKHPDKIFIIVTQPPMNRLATQKSNALRARKLANFLKSSDFLQGIPNLSTFDWFNLLAVSDQNSPYYSMLKPEYSPEGDDSHPNFTANFKTAPEFVKHITSKAIRY